MHEFDVTLLTESRYVNIQNPNRFEQHILDDEALVRGALETRGLRVHRTNWDNKNFDWCSTRTAVFRSTWDYFHRYEDFFAWLNDTSTKTKFINPIETIRWNIDKHYLLDLMKAGINIPPTIFMEKGDKRTLKEIATGSGWKNFILKPAVSGTARHTYKLNNENVHGHEELYSELINNESMLLQEYQHSITAKGEVALMVFGGRFSHAVLKRVKQGDFRVQDDYGGTVHDYIPSADEIQFAEHAAKYWNQLPAYARVDMIWDNNDKICLSELELIEPELWFRKHPPAADMLAEIIEAYIEHL